MKEIRVEKITLNIGVGKPGKELEKAKMLLEKISGMKPVDTLTKKRIPGWSLRPNLVIGCKVTIRGKKAEEVLSSLLEAKDNELKLKSFDNQGNFAFGIHEYLDIPTLDYIPEVGIRGLEVAVTLVRPGFRIKYRTLRTKKVPKRHKISKEEAVSFTKEKFKITIEEEEVEEE